MQHPSALERQAQERQQELLRQAAQVRLVRQARAAQQRPSRHRYSAPLQAMGARLRAYARAVAAG